MFRITSNGSKYRVEEQKWFFGFKYWSSIVECYAVYSYDWKTRPREFDSLLEATAYVNGLKEKRATAITNAERQSRPWEVVAKLD